MQTVTHRFLLTLLCCLLPVLASAGTNQTIQVEWGYTPPSKPAVTGFKLYNKGASVCQTKKPKATAMDCTVALNADTTDFTLTATFSDGTESPHSAPFPFTSGTGMPDRPPATPVGTGSRLFTFNWEPTGNRTAIAGYLVYLNNTLLCTTTNRNATSLACKANLVPGTMSFGLTALYTNGTQSSFSNLLTYTPSNADTTTNRTAPLNDTAARSRSFGASSSTAGVMAASTPGTESVPGLASMPTNHTSTTPANNTPQLDVTDDQGATDAAKAEGDAALANLNLETGEISVGNSWVRVMLAGTFSEPVVLAGPPSANEPCFVRLRNITPTGFEIRLAKRDDLDGSDPDETISYLVMDKGRTILPDGTMIEAGSFVSTPTNQDVRFSGPFNTVPVVLTTLASENEIDSISSRVAKITATSFAHSCKEQEKNEDTQREATINYIAWEPSQGIIGTLRYEVAQAATGLTDAWSIAPFQQSFAQTPFFLAGLQTNNTDTAHLQARTVAPTGVELMVEEDHSKETGTTSPEETVGYLALDQEEPKD